LKDKNIIAFFDFDGTITKRDTLLPFLLYCFGIKKCILGFLRLFPILFLYKSKITSNHKAKEQVFSYFFKGKSKTDITQYSKKFNIEVIPKLLKNSAIAKIKWHKYKGHRVVIVSASVEEYIKFFAESFNVEYIGTKLKYQDALFVGNFEGKNCYGQEKVERINDYIDLSEYDESYGYGDSQGDKEMLGICTKSNFRIFK